MEHLCHTACVMTLFKADIVLSKAPVTKRCLHSSIYKYPHPMVEPKTGNTRSRRMWVLLSQDCVNSGKGQHRNSISE